jgi:hypothetical protein
MKYQLVIEDPYQLLTVHVSGLGSTHTLSPADRKATPTRCTQLPFGLQKVRIPKKRKALKKDRSRPSASSSATSSSSRSSLHSGSVSSSETESSSSSSSKGHGEDDSMNGCSSSSEAADGDDSSQLVEAVSTPDPAFLFEEGSLMGATQEQHQIEEIRRTAASTFFGDLGLSEASLAVSNRSVCGVCNNTIQKKTVRFAYHWNRSRPSKWMHSSCFPDWLNNNPDLKQQAVAFFTNSLDSATEDLRPYILEALQLLEYMVD